MSNIKLTQLTELLTVSPSNTILMATDLSVSPNVSHYVRMGTLTQTDYALANAAFLKANVAYNTGYSANSALLKAGLAFNQANTALTIGTASGTLAQAAFNKANTDYDIAQASFKQANTGSIIAQSAYNQANTGSTTAQASFDKANSDFIHANSAFNLANSLYSNTSSLSLAQAAYNQANTDFVHANSAYNKANTDYIFFSTGYNVANSALSGAISGTALAQAAFNKANTDFDIAQSAYNQANTASNNNGTALAQAAFNKANSDQILAQSAYNQANTASNNNGTALAQAAYNKANTDFDIAQSAYNQANTSYVNSVSSFNQANNSSITASLAFNKANNALPLTGGSLTGTLNFNGTNRLITGDFGDSVVGNRPLFQSNQPNSNTDIMAAPSGTAIISGFTAFGASDPNNSSYGNFWQNGKTTIVEASADGTGVYGNFIIATSSIARINIAANGNIYHTSPVILSADPTTGLQAATKQYVDIASGGLGVGQTWQDVKSSRALGTTYTNSTPKPIEVYVRCDAGLSYGAYVTGYVGSIEVALNRDNGSAGASVVWPTISFIVPPSQTYRVTLSAGTVTVWNELR